MIYLVVERKKSIKKGSAIFQIKLLISLQIFQHPVDNFSTPLKKMFRSFPAHVFKMKVRNYIFDKIEVVE